MRLQRARVPDARNFFAVDAANSFGGREDERDREKERERKAVISDNQEILRSYPLPANCQACG